MTVETLYQSSLQPATIASYHGVSPTILLYTVTTTQPQLGDIKKNKTKSESGQQKKISILGGCDAK